MDVTIAILAGGKSSRMGSDKGLTLLKGKPMIQYIINEVKSLNLPIIIIANNDEYEQFEYPVYKDIVLDKGPVGGIYTALQKSRTEKIIIVSCDTPFVTKKLLMRLLHESEGYDVVIPSLNGKEHPLIGVYSKGIEKCFKGRLDNNQLKLRLAIKDVNYRVVTFQNNDEEIDRLNFINVNTREELKKLEL